MKNSISSFCAVFIVACLMVIVCFVAKAKNDGDIAVADAEHIEDVIATMKAECNVYDTNPNFESGCERIRTEFSSNEEAINYSMTIAGRPIDKDGFFMDDPNYISYQEPESIVFEYKGMLYNLKGECLGETTNLDYTNELYESDLEYVPPHDTIDYGTLPAPSEDSSCDDANCEEPCDKHDFDSDSDCDCDDCNEETFDTAETTDKTTEDLSIQENESDEVFDIENPDMEFTYADDALAEENSIINDEVVEENNISENVELENTENAED